MGSEATHQDITAQTVVLEKVLKEILVELKYANKLTKAGNHRVSNVTKDFLG